jgi:hypothetical protein
MEKDTSEERADRPSWLLRLVLVAALAAAAYLVWFYHDPPQPRITLASGAELELITVQRGGVSITSDSRFLALLRRLLPSRMKDWLPSEFTGSNGNPEDLVAYFRFTYPTNTPPGANLRTWTWFVAEDSTGHRYGLEGGGSSSGYGNNQHIESFQLRSSPRREKEFKLLFLDGKYRVVHSVMIPNPIRGPFPAWSPEPLPIRRTNGPVVATLERIVRGPNPDHPWVSPTLTFESSDPAWKNAKNRYVSFTDATGNHGNPLSPTEPAWKLQIDVHRPNNNDFLPDEKLVLTHLAVQGPGQFLPLDARAEMNGVQLLVHGLAGPGALVFTNGAHRTMEPPTSSNAGWRTTSTGSSTNQEESFGSRKAFFLIEATGTQEGDDLRMILRDDAGTEIPFDNSHGYNIRNGTQYHTKDFTPPPGVTNVSLEIIVSRPLKFEFLVDPREIRAANP